MRARQSSRDPKPVQGTYTTSTGVHVDASDGPGKRKRMPGFARRTGERRSAIPHWKKRVRSALAVAAAIGGFALFAGLYGDIWLTDTAPSAVPISPAPTAAAALAESTALPVQTPYAPAASSVPEEVRVWLPVSGQRYHANPACSGMRDAAEAPLAQAKAWGYTPCKRCNPPE